jgi:hypothetical protein
MIKQTDHYAGADAEPLNSEKSGDQTISSGQMKDAVDGALRLMRQQAMTPATPKGIRNTEMRTLEAYIERRRKLAARIRSENPTCTDEEIEARLEQFGA